MFYASQTQKAIREFIIECEKKSEQCEVVVIAPAGCGKTSTLLYIIEDLSQRHKLAYLVFNVDMKSELKQRINFANSPFDINTDNLEHYTFHGFMRKILSSKIKDIEFDYLNGEIGNAHAQIILKHFNISTENIDTSNFCDSFNSFIKSFVKTTKNIETFKNENRNINFNESTYNIIKRIMVQEGYDSRYLSEINGNEQQRICREAYYLLIDKIFEDNILKSKMPHDIYYKYAYHHYKDIDLFSEYKFVLVDEAQDIDPIISALLDKCKISIIKVGDRLQRINAFRGTVDSLSENTEDNHNRRRKVFYLEDSYRLTPYMGLLTEAFLKIEGTKLGLNIKEIPSILGCSRENVTLKDTKIKIKNNADFFKEIIEEYKKIDVKDSETFRNAKKHKTKIESSIFGGRKTIVENGIKKFNKKKNHVELFKLLNEHTSLFYNTDEENELFEKALESLESKTNIELIKELNKIARDYTFKLTNREMREILISENGTHGYITRSNKKAIDALFRFVNQIPEEKLSEIPLFNIKFALSLADTFDNFTKHKFSTINTKDTAMMIKQLDSVESEMFKGESVWDVISKLSSMDMYEQLSESFIKNPDFGQVIIDAKFIKISGIAKSFSDFGVNGSEIKDIVVNAINRVKKYYKANGINPDEVSIKPKDLIEQGGLRTIKHLIPFDKIIKSQVSLTAIEGNKMNLLENYYKYTSIKDRVKNNPNIELVKDGAFYNFYVSTTHKAKGLEFDNTLIGDDIYKLEDIEDENDKIGELNLAYVAITRAKRSVSLEENSPLIETFDDIYEKNFERFYSTKNRDKEAIISEKLNCGTEDNNPCHNVYTKDLISNKITSNQMYYFDGSTFPLYKNLVAVFDKMSGNCLAVEESTKQNPCQLLKDNSNIGISFYHDKDMNKEVFVDKINEWKMDLEAKEFKSLQGIENAPF